MPVEELSESGHQCRTPHPANGGQAAHPATTETPEPPDGSSARHKVRKLCRWPTHPFGEAAGYPLCKRLAILGFVQKYGVAVIIRHKFPVIREAHDVIPLGLLIAVIIIRKAELCPFAYHLALDSLFAA